MLLPDRGAAGDFRPGLPGRTVHYRRWAL